MQNYTVETGGRTFTIMADNYRIVNNEYISVNQKYCKKVDKTR